MTSSTVWTNLLIPTIKQQRFETADTGIKNHPVLLCRIFYCNFAVACFPKAVSELPFINALPQYIFIFPGKQRKAQVTRGGVWEVQTVQSVQWRRHPVTRFSGSHSERIFPEEEAGHVKLMYVLSEGARHCNFAKICFTELWISKKYAFYFWSSVARCVIAPPKILLRHWIDHRIHGLNWFEHVAYGWYYGIVAYIRRHFWLK